MSEWTGHCLCGDVSYQINADPAAVRICWCRDCQRISANGTVNAIFPTAAIQVSGQTSSYSSTADSGNQVRRRFCARCGSHLFADSSGRPGLTVVRVGSLDDPSRLKPSANIWSSSAPRWACLDPALMQVEGQPAPPPAACVSSSAQGAA